MIGSSRIGIYTNANNWSEPQPRDGPLSLSLRSAVVPLCSLFVFRSFLFPILQERRDGRCQGVRILPRLVSISAESRGRQCAVGSVAGSGVSGCFFFTWLTCFFIFECCTMRDFICQGTHTMITRLRSPIGAASARGRARRSSSSTMDRPSAVPSQKHAHKQPASSPAIALAAHPPSCSRSVTAPLTLFDPLLQHRPQLVRVSDSTGRPSGPVTVSPLHFFLSPSSFSPLPQAGLCTSNGSVRAQRRQELSDGRSDRVAMRRGPGRAARHCPRISLHGQPPSAVLSPAVHSTLTRPSPALSLSPRAFRPFHLQTRRARSRVRK